MVVVSPVDLLALTSVQFQHLLRVHTDGFGVTQGDRAFQGDEHHVVSGVDDAGDAVHLHATKNMNLHAISSSRDAETKKIIPKLK